MIGDAGTSRRPAGACRRLYTASLASRGMLTVVPVLGVPALIVHWCHGFYTGAVVLALFLVAFFWMSSRLYLTIDVVNGDTLAFCGGGRCALVPIAAARSVLQGGLKAPFTLCLVTTLGRRFHLPIALTSSKIGPLLELLKERVPSLGVYVTVLLE